MTIDPRSTKRLDIPEGHKRGLDGRWRDGHGRYVEHPPLDADFSRETKAIREWVNGQPFSHVRLQAELDLLFGEYVRNDLEGASEPPRSILRALLVFALLAVVVSMATTAYLALS